MLAQVKTILAVRAAEKGLGLECRVSPSAPACVVGDPLRLGQILLNLAGNAVKFTEQGRVTVSLRERAAPALDKAYCWLECMVADTGVGMTEAERANLFRSFTQADASTTRRFGGTGLGLAITRQLVEAMHGEIACESSPGHGTTFRVRLRFDRAVEGVAVGAPGELQQLVAQSGGGGRRTSPAFQSMKQRLRQLPAAQSMRQKRPST